MATLTKLFSLEVLPNLTLLTQTDSVVDIEERDRLTDVGSNPSFDLP